MCDFPVFILKLSIITCAFCCCFAISCLPFFDGEQAKHIVIFLLPLASSFLSSTQLPVCDMFTVMG